MKVYETAEALRERFNRKEKEEAIFLTNLYIRALECLYTPAPLSSFIMAYKTVIIIY